MKKITVWCFVIVLVVLVAITIGGGFYMLEFSLSPDPTRADTDSCYRQLFTNYPETKEWMDSLRTHHALRDTMITMPEGYRCHTYYINRGSQRTAMVIHGWRDQAIKFFFLARMYERLLGYNVVMPDLYASGKSDGEALRKPMPQGIKDLRFVADCGYTSVWDEFARELQHQFGLPEFPLMHATSLLCQLRYGWNFDEASALRQVAKCQYPMFFIHGDQDDFVPTDMVYQLYDAKPAPKALWITKDTDHAHSYKNYPDEYVAQVRKFLGE